MMDYSNLISEIARDIKPSGIRKFFDLLTTKKDVISLTVGEPDFFTPWHIREKAINVLEKGQTYYTSNNGIMELRCEICNYLSRRFDVTYEPSKEVIVTVGGSEAIDIGIRTLINPGDEVIIPQPAFVCYGPLVELAKGKPVYIETKAEEKFKLTPDALKKAITPKTKLLILPYPNNPTGAIMTKEELSEIADVLRGTDIFIMSDEIYAELTYCTKHTSIASIDGMFERTLLVSGFSKAYAMTGWRLGYICAPKEIIKEMHKIHQYAIMCSPTISQFAAIDALKNGDDDVKMMRDEYNRRRRYILDGVRKIGIDCFEAEGAFYIYPDIRKFGLSSDEFCMRLLNECSVAIVPGSAFGECGEGFSRISYAYSIDHIKKALEALDQFVQSL